ncbi:RDD family protein [Verrucomicrobium sp. BvORR034]|uniref:RDD family protein n=1 Tax=Verrucomicrobium sp. BvORR034 TaxID=1396418 RepID=UPI0006792164|nr:RDD family protein [Verrucomicrobium sp. BvORR034]
MEYHLSIAGDRSGPHSQFRIIEQIREGLLKGDELVWRLGVPNWVPLRELDEFDGYWPPAPDVLAAAEVTKHVAREELDRPRPWMRFWARMVDYFWFSFTLGLALRGLLPPEAAEVLMRPGMEQWLINSVTLLLFVPLEAWFLSQRGTTPGKALLRIQVRSLDGSLPTYQQALMRSVQVWLKGMGLCLVPVIALIAMAWWRIRLLQKGFTSWDESCHTRVEHGQPEPWRMVVLAGLVALLLVLGVLTLLMSKEMLEAMRNLPK